MQSLKNSIARGLKRACNLCSSFPKAGSTTLSHLQEKIVYLLFSVMTSDVLQTMYLHILRQNLENTGQIKVLPADTVQTHRKKQFWFQTTFGLSRKSSQGKEIM